MAPSRQPVRSIALRHCLGIPDRFLAPGTSGLWLGSVLIAYPLGSVALPVPHPARGQLPALGLPLTTC